MALCAYRNAEWLSAVYAMVDDVCVCDGALPPGMFGALTRLVDGARSNDSADEFLPYADQMLIAIHRLRATLAQRGDGGGGPAAIRAELHLMCRDWIKMARFC